MCSKFILKNKDRKVGILDLDNKTFILDKDYTGYLPWPLYTADKDRNYIPTPEDIYKFCAERVVQEDNQALPDILDKLNWSNLSVVELCKITHGMQYTDFLWFVPIEHDDDWKFDHKHIRGKYYTGKANI